MAAFAENASPENFKGDFNFFTDEAFLEAGGGPADERSWLVQLKSISSKGATFALFDTSDDHFGKATGVPRRELGILAFSPSGTSVAPFQFVIPKAEQAAGKFAQFRPTDPKSTVAYQYQKGQLDNLMTLNGHAKVENGGAVELSYGADEAGPSVKVFEAFKQKDGEWSVRYRWPLSCYQAFAIAVSVLHCPVTSSLDSLTAAAPPDAGGATAEKQRALLMAAEASGAMSRQGKLGAAHSRLYLPSFGGETSFGTALLELLGRVGISDGERQAKALTWAESVGVSSLIGMYALLEAEGDVGGWKEFENAIQAKAYHKMRIQAQLKKATGNADGKEPQESNRGVAGPSYWAQLG